MERAFVNPNRQRIPWFEDDRASHHHNAEYLRRLSKLREELVYQEQANLTTALERFQMKPNGKDQIFGRTKEKGVSLPRHKSDQPPQKTLVTTLDKFQRMRPKKSAQRVMLLEGKQIIEPRTSNDLRAGSETSRSDPGIALVNETVRTSMRKLLQPTPSIPSIARKSPKGQKDFIVGSSTWNKRTNDELYRLGNASYKRFSDPVTNTFGQRGSYVNSPRYDRDHTRSIGQYRKQQFRNIIRADADELNIDTNSVRLERLGNTQTGQTDRVNDCYCVYYVPTPTPICVDRGHGSIGNPLPPISKESGVKYRSGRESPHALESGSTSSMPQITDSSSISSSISNHSGNINDTLKIDGRQKEVQESKKHIIIDMPTIIFKSATPDISEMELENQNSAVGLAKTYKQNELRQRELRNLIEDVKEINKRTETLYSIYNKSNVH